MSVQHMGKFEPMQSYFKDNTRVLTRKWKELRRKDLEKKLKEGQEVKLFQPRVLEPGEYWPISLSKELFELAFNVSNNYVS